MSYTPSNVCKCALFRYDNKEYLFSVESLFSKYKLCIYDVNTYGRMIAAIDNENNCRYEYRSNNYIPIINATIKHIDKVIEYILDCEVLYDSYRFGKTIRINPKTNKFSYCFHTCTSKNNYSIEDISCEKFATIDESIKSRMIDKRLQFLSRMITLINNNEDVKTIKIEEHNWNMNTCKRKIKID